MCHDFGTIVLPSSVPLHVPFLPTFEGEADVGTSDSHGTTDSRF